MRWGLWGLLGGLVLLAAACAGGSDDIREVAIDHIDDEVASSYLLYFPRNVTVRPGDTVVFKQEWTGEPHSVTMGTMVDEALAVVGPLLDEYGDRPEAEVPPEILQQYGDAMAPLPLMVGEGVDDSVQQPGAQPCFLEQGAPPLDPDTPCTDEQQLQPPFNGRQTYYNSGFIPYVGPQGNEFRLPLAEDIAPGVYQYYCNLHGPFMRGTVTVAPPDAQIPSQAEVAQQGRDEVEAVAQPLRDAYARAGDSATDQAEVEGITYSKPYAGFFDERIPDAIISEFIPRRIEVDAGDAVTWSFVGGHTVSFDVPTYVAQITVGDDGTVTFNPDAYGPVDSPALPVEEPAPEADAPAEPVIVDAGDFDGSGFVSSGVSYGIGYRLRFTRSGVYPYACLIHPQMVGEVVVR